MSDPNILKAQLLVCIAILIWCLFNIVTNKKMNLENEPEEYYHECSVCGKPIVEQGICNSSVCIKVDNEL